MNILEIYKMVRGIKKVNGHSLFPRVEVTDQTKSIGLRVKEKIYKGPEEQ